MIFLYIFRNHQRGGWSVMRYGGGSSQARHSLTASMECFTHFICFVSDLGNIGRNNRQE